MNLRETVQKLTDKLNIGHIDPKLAYALLLFGLLVIAASVWLSVRDWQSEAVSQQIQSEAEAAVNLLIKPISALDRLFTDEQVQALAMRALEKPEATGDLAAYLNGRISEISDVRVFGPDLSALNAGDLGPNGFAILDMLLQSEQGKDPGIQLHSTMQPPMMQEVIRLGSADEIRGYLLVTLDPEYILSHFNPQYSTLGYVAIVQNNGRQPASYLKEFGDSSLKGQLLERHPIAGTLLRIEHPQYQYIRLLGPGLLFVLLLTGAVIVGVAVFLLRNNRTIHSLDQRTGPVEKLESDERMIDEGMVSPPPSETARSASAVVPPPVKEDESAAEPAEPQAPEADEPPPMHLRYDIAERLGRKKEEHEPVDLKPAIFRAYDIRGVMYKNLDAGIARQIGQVLGTVALERNAAPIVVARDGRLSGPELQHGMMEGIMAAGCDVLNVGAVPTGVLYYAAHEMGAGSGVMITGSHNPPDYNGFKIMLGGDTLYGDEIKDIHRRIIEGDYRSGTAELKRKDVISRYIDRVAEDIQIDRPLRVVIDCGNGIGGVCAADTLRAIGAEVLPLFDEVDGTFPNHHPDPSVPENLEDLVESVRLMDADLGLALDGDADRLGVVTLGGNIIYPDRVMMLLAMDVLDRQPGATIIYDVKCTGHLADVIREAGGNPVMYKTGHSLIKAKMKEIGSPFAGEMSGHFFFGERWYGVDDGIYGAARLLEILAGTDTPPEAILNALPSSYSTPELKVEMDEGQNHEFIAEFTKVARFDDAKISTIDGIRADFHDGWGLVRASNTTPILVVRFDAESEVALERIKAVFRSQMLSIAPGLDLPF